VASNKQEFSARTLRPKLHQKLAEYLIDSTKPVVHPVVWPGRVIPLAELEDAIDKTRSMYPINGTDTRCIPGEHAAHRVLQEFINTKLLGYSDLRNDPTMDGQSGLSPYLHFGNIASITAVRMVKELTSARPDLQRDSDAFIEEIVVRKELSDNFCLFSSNYTSLSAVPEWAQKTLSKHAADPRDFTYSSQQFEAAETHDPAWNAAQSELRKTGKMHGYMRMYWAKKVLEWSKSPDDALAILVYLNDFYSIDGGDPNGYAGILWSIGGLHDRPWGERPIYGTVRSMVYNGLKRKFAVAEYEKMWLQ
jgi:deoxyribodipyrimidine photo-lyase